MSCPFSDFSNLINPRAMFKQLREERPVYFDDTLDAYIVSRYENVEEILKQPNTFSSALALFTSYNHEDVVNEILTSKARGPFHSILPMTDPPEHTPIREALNAMFSAKRISQFKTYIEGRVKSLIDAFIDDGKAEVMSQLAVPLPVSVIANIMSVPLERSGDIMRWTRSYSACSGNRIVTKEEAAEIGNDLARMQNYIMEHVEARRYENRDDVLTDIVNVRINGRRFSDGEILAIVAAFLMAGHETVSIAIVSLMKSLAENPSAVDFLRGADESAIKNFIEEILRLNAPVRMLPRVCTRDYEVGGVVIQAQKKVLILLGSSNEDELLFGENADELGYARKNARRHLSFGAGPHMCLGNMLARTELFCLTKAVVDRMDHIKLVNKKYEKSDYMPIVLDLNLHLNNLEITFDKRKSS